jgi:hypothetical protein
VIVTGLKRQDAKIAKEAPRIYMILARLGDLGALAIHSGLCRVKNGNFVRPGVFVTWW